MVRKNLIVFGGTGWVGQHIVSKAAAAGWEVTSVSRRGAAPYMFPDAWRVQWLSCDVSNRASVEELLTRVPTPVDAVISTIGLLTLDRTEAIRINGAANTNIVAALYNRQQIILKNAAGATAGATSAVFATSDAVAEVSGQPTGHEQSDADGRHAALVRAQSESELTAAARSQLPPLTNHASGLPRFVYVSAGNFGYPFTRLLRGYYDGKIATEKAMLSHMYCRGAILRPGAIHGVRRTASGNFPIPLSPIFAPMELLFAPLHRLTDISLLQPPVHVDTVAAAALACCSDLDPASQAMRRYRVEGGYGHARGGVVNFNDGTGRKVEDDCPIFEYDGIKCLAGLWKAH